MLEDVLGPEGGASGFIILGDLRDTKPQSGLSSLEAYPHYLKPLN